MITILIAVSVSLVSLVANGSLALAEAPKAPAGTFQNFANAGTGGPSAPAQPPSAEAIDEFLRESNLLTLADDFGMDAVLFLRQEDEAKRFREAFTPERYASSWLKPVEAGTLVLIHGRLYARDFYRATAFSKTGSALLDARQPHEIGAEQWSINTTGGKLAVELELKQNTDGTVSRKGIATGLLIDLLLQSSTCKTVTLYRGVKGREGKLYAELSSLRKGGQLPEANQLIKEHLDSYAGVAGAGTFTTPSAQAAGSFAMNTDDPSGAVVVYTIDKEKLKAARDGLYMGIESDYFEIAFSSPEARALLFGSITKVCGAKELKTISCLEDSRSSSGPDLRTQ